MQCPFGSEVGEPPVLVRCPRGFPGCACADEWIAAETGQDDAQTHRVLAWWGEHR